jgi:hypothetical protein
MTELAQGMVALNGQPMRIVHFTEREDVAEIMPAPPDPPAEVAS